MRRRDLMVGVRINQAERALLERAAADQGLALATLLRREGLEAARRVVRRGCADVAQRDRVVQPA